jgi:hypothetical protein
VCARVFRWGSPDYNSSSNVTAACCSTTSTLYRPDKQFVPSLSPGMVLFVCIVVLDPRRPGRRLAVPLYLLEEGGGGGLLQPPDLLLLLSELLLLVVAAGFSCFWLSTARYRAACVPLGSASSRLFLLLIIIACMRVCRVGVCCYYCCSLLHISISLFRLLSLLILASSSVIPTNSRGTSLVTDIWFSPPAFRRTTGVSR